MERGKLSMKLISNEKSRKITFHKRKASLLRKAYELSTLCDVCVCVFVYGPNQNDQSPLQVHTWPSCRDEVNKMIASYKANCLHKCARKASDLLDYFSERKKKIETNISKVRKDVAEARFPKWEERLDHLLEDQLRVLMVELDSKLEMTKRRMEKVAEGVEEGTTSGESSQTLNVNIKKKEVMTMFDEEESYGVYGIRSSSIMEETQAIMPYHQLQTMAQSLQMMDHKIGANGSSSQFQLSYYGNNNNNNHNYCFQNCPNFYNDPTMCHYGLLPLATQSILPLSYMQNDDQMMVALPNNASSQMMNQDQFDYFNYEYFFNP